MTSRNGRGQHDIGVWHKLSCYKNQTLRGISDLRLGRPSLKQRFAISINVIFYLLLTCLTRKVHPTYYHILLSMLNIGNVSKDSPYLAE